MNEWYTDYDKVVYVGNYLFNNLGLRAGELQYYYEKPWNYTGEWNKIKGEYNE